jgi:hypothetical protein
MVKERWVEVYQAEIRKERTGASHFVVLVRSNILIAVPVS